MLIFTYTYIVCTGGIRMKEKSVYRCKRCGDVFYCPTGFVDELIFKFRLFFKFLSCPRCGSTLIDEEQYLEEKKKQDSAPKGR